LGIHDGYYGGFAKYVTITDDFSQQMQVEDFYTFIGLKMLAETHDIDNESIYNQIMSDFQEFMRDDLEDLWLYYDPKPLGDGLWHRVGVNNTEVYDDPISFALLGLYTYDGWSTTCQRVYNFVQTIRASGQFPAYQPCVCWPGYIDVVSRFPACPYYDGVTTGILWRIRRERDQPSFKLSMQIVVYQEEFMNWGPVFTDYSPIVEQKAMANVSWLGRLYLNYDEPVTTFTRGLAAKGENILLYPVRQTAEQVEYGDPLDMRAIVTPLKASEVILEAGYFLNDYITLYTFLPVRTHDKVRRLGEDYEIQSVQIHVGWQTGVFQERGQEAFQHMTLEDPVTTIQRLLTNNIHVAKDDGNLASILVTTEWYDREFLKQYDGQITIGLEQSLDEKLNLQGNLRRRVLTFRCYAWTVDKTVSSDPGKVMRDKIIAEVNRIIRTNRNNPCITNLAFNGLGYPAPTTHKAFSSGASAEISPSHSLWNELSPADYQKLWTSDDNRYTKSHNINGEYAIMLFRFRIDARMETLKRLEFSFEGYGTAPSGNGFIIEVWDNAAEA
jgi:hypothetical protein